MIFEWLLITPYEKVQLQQNFLVNEPIHIWDSANSQLIVVQNVEQILETRIS
jgi:hypothetical protein